MNISIVVGTIFAVVLVAITVLYSRSNGNNRARQAKNDGTTCSATSDASNINSSSSTGTDCADGPSSCDSGGDSGGGGD